MEMAPARFPGRAPIDSYGNGGFRFADMSHQGSILCLMDGIMAWPVTSLDEVDERALAPLFKSQNKPELFLLGVGEKLVPVSARLRSAFRDYNIRLEPMDTGAAARTFNVLLAESRKVTAGLIAVEG